MNNRQKELLKHQLKSEKEILSEKPFAHLFPGPYD